MVLIFLMWIAGNIPNKVDVEWIKRGGGIVGNDHPPAYRFNAGQKMIYWIVVLGGRAVAVTGYLLMFPFYAHRHRRHAARPDRARHRRACCSSPPCSAHIYIGTIGMEGAFEAMGEGTVDVNWAKRASQPLAGAGNGAHRPERIAAPADGDAGRIDWGRSHEKLSLLPVSRRS